MLIIVYRAYAATLSYLVGDMPEEADLLKKLEEIAGSRDEAEAYFRDQPVPEAGGKTLQELVRAGRAEAARAYLEHVDRSGFA